MTTEILQVRDVPTEDARVLRARAAARNQSLSSYLRELIHAEATTPEIGEVLGRISSRSAVEADTEDIRAFIDDDRR